MEVDSSLRNEIEYLREILNKTIVDDKRDRQKILFLSHKLDILIVKYTQQHINLDKLDMAV